MPTFGVWQKFGTKTEHHSLRQVIAPSFLHVTPKYYYLRLVVPLIVGNHRYDRKYGWYTLKVHPTYSTFQPRGPIRVRSGRAARGAVHAIANPVHDGVE